MDPPAETRRTLACLRDLIEDSDVPHDEIERRLGLARGRLHRLLSGAIEIKLWQLVAIGDTLGLPPGQLFRQLFPRPASAPRRVEVISALAASEDVVLIYAFGIAALSDLRERLATCEEALAKLPESALDL